MRVSNKTIRRENVNLTLRLRIDLVVVIRGDSCCASDRFGGFMLVELW